MISTQNLSVHYDKAPILSGLNLQALPKDFIGIIGPNGAGKSCLIKTLAGILSPLSGRVELNGGNLTDLSPKQKARRLAYLAQDKQIFWHGTVHDLVALGRAPYRGALGRLSADGKQAVITAMHEAQCYDLRDRRYDTLSGGEKMRVHLARSFAVQADVLIVDEPTTALDPYYQLSILEALRTQAASGKTIIASLHDLALARKFCSRIWVVHDGRLVCDGLPQEALSHDILRTVFKIKPNTNVEQTGWELA